MYIFEEFNSLAVNWSNAIVFLVGKSFVAVGKMDDAAIREAVIQECSLHHFIVAMRIDADIVNLLGAIIQNLVHQSFFGAIACHTMNHAVYFGVKPFSIFDYFVCWLFADNKKECAHYPSSLNADITAPLINIVDQSFGIRIIGAPLMQIARLSHKSSCFIINLDNFRDLICRSCSDFHFSSVRNILLVTKLIKTSEYSKLIGAFRNRIAWSGNVENINDRTIKIGEYLVFSTTKVYFYTK